MAWIDVIPEDEADEALAALYDRARDPSSDRVDHILSVHSLHPPGLAAHLDLYRAVMASTPTLRKVEREMIAVTVSAINGCHY